MTSKETALADYCRELGREKSVIESRAASLRLAAELAISALEAALPTLEEHAEEEREFWGETDKHGDAAQAEKVLKNARHALSFWRVSTEAERSSPNVKDEPRRYLARAVRKHGS
jgi:hypothetical protein